MLRNNVGNSSDSKNEDGSVFSQTEHDIVATYLIMAGMDIYSINSNFAFKCMKKSRGVQHKEKHGFRESVSSPILLTSLRSYLPFLSWGAHVNKGDGTCSICWL